MMRIGNVTFLTSSWATTTDAYAVENLWQGGWRDVNTGYYHFQERWYSPSMQWLSWDPKNYVNGSDAYTPEGDGAIDQVDPSGEIKVTSKPSSGEYHAGQFDVLFNFALDAPASGDGYFVQQVTVTRKLNDPDSIRPIIKNVVNFDKENDGNGQPIVYWEAWRVACGQVYSTGVDAGSWTDEANEDSYSDGQGTVTQAGIIKFFLVSHKGVGELGDELSNPVIQPAGGSGFGFSQDYGIKNDPIPNSTFSPGKLPSTGTKPAWWDDPSDDKEGTATRSVSITWNDVGTKNVNNPPDVSPAP